MMRSHVCQQCRLQLSRRLPTPRHPQLQSKATIVSFRKNPNAPQTNHEAQPPPEEAQNEDIAVQEGQSQGLRIPYERRGQETDLTQGHHNNYSEGNGAAGWYSRSAQPTGPPGQHRQKQYRETKSAFGSDAVTSVAQTINGFLKRNNVKAAWDLFDKTYSSRDVPALTDPSLSDIPVLTGGGIFTRLAQGISMEFAHGNNQVPTPTEVLFRYEQLDIAPKGIWKQTIAQLTYEFLLSMAPADQRGAPTSISTTQRGTEAILVELLSLWKLFFQRHGTQQDRDPFESINSEWKTIPESEVRFEAGKNYGARLQQFHRTHPTGPELQYSAINIFNYFYGETQPPRTIPDALREQNQPFLRLLTSTLAGSNIVVAFKHAEVNAQIKSLGEEYRRSIAAQMDLAPSLARRINGLDPSVTPEEKASYLQESFLKRIYRQVMMQANVRGLEEIWGEVETTYKASDAKPLIPPPVYNAFLSGFMTLFQPDHAVKVWNHMIAHGVKPDLETWNAMLMGCAKAKDLAGMNAVWDRMLRSGFEPDQRCWTTRVHSTIGTHVQVEAGLVILDEMGKRWLSAENAIKDAGKAKGARNLQSSAKMANNFTKPAIGVINGAVDAIAQLPLKGKVLSHRSKGITFETKLSYVHKILQWAGNFGIKPDARTYNALIKLYLEGNDFPTTFKLLRQMEKEGIEGDLATHTMLLRAAFDNQKFDDLSHQEQADRVLGLFDQLEQGGLKPNTYVYQIAVDRLLKNFKNYKGVRAVIDHMMSRGFAVSPQIYTSLVTHYFQQDPPAIREIDSLVTRILGPPAAPTDRFLFDRLIEGYARVGEIASMMTVLTKMGAHGKRPSFVALIEVVKALYKAGKWDRARAIVRDVQLGTGVAKDAPTNLHQVDRDQFFYVVRALAPELLESLAGEHLSAPGSARGDRVAQAMQGDASYEQPQAPYQHELYEQQQYEQYQQQQQHYDQSGHEQVPSEETQMSYQQAPNGQTRYQQTPEVDTEYVNAEHDGYLSDESQAPRHW
ncbi:uncharacterized protein N0V89_000911 [Didymosphaeria variabile]|uniref:Pentacotripeptide-repeat region of PRORP domain-containing protein n=1 Tax=Didymosphaeria variabile TaxID=1932322 RepID=A0A9W9CG53_9PLEO|nr:uncharacterized protein N0V89_000911 [Didymosphaeria variabile]KAJ4360349.1 hypothetical protein N0V89_000911 [Didymosphaeria variabile]